MFVCPACDCHVHWKDAACPFCGVVRDVAPAPQLGLGALALVAVTALGVSACASDPRADAGESADGMTVTTVVATETSGSTTVVTTTGEETETETETGTSLTFVPNTEFAALYGECDPWAQDCPEGEKCVPYGSTGQRYDANKCVEITGDKQAGEPCSYAGLIEAGDDCDALSICWDVEDVDGQELGTCRAFCEGTPDDPLCPDGSSCLFAFEGSLNVCLVLCDPLLQDCEDGLGCHWNDYAATFNCWRGEVAQGDPCWFEPEDCAVGQACVLADLLPMCGAELCCTPYCDLDNPSCAPAGTECASFFEPEMAPVGLEGVGVCVVPP